MKKHLINSLIILLIFIVTAFFTLLTFAISQGAFSESIGMDKGLSMILTFVVLFLLSWSGLMGFKRKINTIGVFGTMTAVLTILIYLNLDGATIKYTYKIVPFYISWILGVYAGYNFYVRVNKKFIIPLLLSIFPITMSLGLYDLWFHRIEYGNWTGEVAAKPVASFELFDKEGAMVNNESLKGKIILFDFWFVGCGPCWVKFPDLQRLYEQYESNPIVEIYAVNRPMEQDKPGALFSRIEDKEYTFPVLKGTQEIMDALDVYKYPTVMLINANGEMVFMGELESAEEKLKTMLDAM